MSDTCGYHQLLAELEYYRTGMYVRADEPCQTETARYVGIGIQAGDFGGQTLTQLCAEHYAAVVDDGHELTYDVPMETIAVNRAMVRAAVGLA